MATWQQNADNRAPVFMRSYKNTKKVTKLVDVKIWEAARATSAAPAYFEPITVNGIRMVDGGLQANDPIGW